MHDVSRWPGIFGKSEMFGMYRISETSVYAYIHKREPGSQEGLLPTTTTTPATTTPATTTTTAATTTTTNYYYCY